MVVELTKGALPWRSKPDKNEVMKCKEGIRSPVQRRRFLEDCPREFEKVFVYIVTIQYWDKPDYDYCRRE